MSQTPTQYRLQAIFNGLTINKRTADLDKTLQELKPEQLHTEMYITVKKGKEVAERKLNLIQARRLFTDADVRQVFLNNLLLT